MTREALEAALAIHASQRTHDDLLQIALAARKQLALMAETCGYCENPGFAEDCEFCNSTGKVYPQETVKLLARIIYDENMGAVQKAVAVLDALNGDNDG